MSAGDWKDLYKGVLENNYALVEFYLKNGVDVNYQHPEILMTPLVTAIKSGYTDMALLLLRNGADPKLDSYYDQMNAIEAALEQNNTTILNEMKIMGYSIDFKTKLSIYLKRLFK